MEYTKMVEAIQAIFHKNRLYFGKVDGTWNADTANAYQGWCLSKGCSGIQARTQPSSIDTLEPSLRDLVLGVVVEASEPPDGEVTDPATDPAVPPAAEGAVPPAAEGTYTEGGPAASNAEGMVPAVTDGGTATMGMPYDVSAPETQVPAIDSETPAAKDGVEAVPGVVPAIDTAVEEQQGNSSNRNSKRR